MLRNALIPLLCASGAIAALLQPAAPAKPPARFNLKRQLGTCEDANMLTCGTGCIDLDYKCCPDDSAGCQIGTYCDLGDNGVYGCCENGETCQGDGHINTLPGDVIFTTQDLIGGGGGGGDTATFGGGDSFTTEDGGELSVTQSAKNGFQTPASDSSTTEEAEPTRANTGGGGGNGLPIQTTNVDDLIPTLTIPTNAPKATGPLPPRPKNGAGSVSGSGALGLLAAVVAVVF